MKPTIVTHLRPHLDEICALWLIQKYWPQFEDADIEFVATGPTGGERWENIEPDSNPFVIYVGVGQGKFDEHKGAEGDDKESAASLIWQETQNRCSIPKGYKEAVDRIVEYVKKEDLGHFMKNSNGQFGLPAILSGLYGINGRDSKRVYEVGRQLMEAIMFEMIKRVSAEKDWEGRREFDTPWGRGAAYISDVPGVERIAYSEGFVLVVNHNTTKTYHGFRADPDSSVDLTNVALRIEQLEPQAEWFLHQSKRMLLCGGDITNTTNNSNLSLDQLIQLVKKED